MKYGRDKKCVRRESQRERDTVNERERERERMKEGERKREKERERKKERERERERKRGRKKERKRGRPHTTYLFVISSQYNSLSLNKRNPTRCFEGLSCLIDHNNIKSFIL